MNKKFLSVILFSTLMVGTAGTFTSCKDYDDDIEQINNELSGIKSQIEALEGKIKDGKWITSVAQTANGLTITLSDGTTYDVTNGKGGAAGTPGAAGTDWTISEDGYWVCNGEKTDVKAVGQDGEKGEAGQQEVKFENGKWFLWNGTEFVEFKGATTSGNIPYYYTDPNDNNYTILVVYSQDGQTKKEIRLPMNEGLAQLTVLDANFSQGAANIVVNYALRKVSTEWDGERELPAVGEYMVATNTQSILVQVTPANYDLATLDLKFVNGKGEEVPVTVGKATPTTITRQSSITGVYEIPVTVNPIKENEELVNFYQGKKQISLVANESVRSTYTSTLQMVKSNQPVGNVAYQVWQWNPITQQEEWMSKYTTVAAEDLLVTPKDDVAAKIYDSYLTIKDDQTNNAKAIKYGISVDGMTVKSAENAQGQSIVLIAHYVDVIGKVYKQEITVTFQGEYVEPETIDLTASEHTIAFVKSAESPSLIANFDEYFKDIQGDDRIVWNSEHEIFVPKYYPQQQYVVNYVYTDPEDYSTHEGQLFGFVAAVEANEEGATLNTEEGLAKFKNLKISLDYTKAFDGNGIDLLNYDVTYTLQVLVQNTATGAVDYVNVPFTVEQPAAAEIAKQYAFDAIAYDAATNAFTVFGTEATLSDLIKVSAKGFENGVSIATNEAAKPAGVTTEDYKVANGKVTLSNIDKYGTAYSVTGVYVKYANHKFAVPAFNVIFKKAATEATYTFSLKKAVSVVRGGSAVTLKVGTDLTIADAAGNPMKDIVVTAVDLETAANNYVSAGTTDGKSIIITPKDIQIAKDTAFKAKIKFTYDSGKTGETEANVLVTVKAI